MFGHKNSYHLGDVDEETPKELEYIAYTLMIDMILIRLTSLSDKGVSRILVKKSLTYLCFQLKIADDDNVSQTLRSHN